MIMRRENLIAALSLAIKAQETAESHRGYTGPSGLLAGWQEVLDAMRRGEHVEIRD